MQKEAGQAMVEAALVIPILIALMMGTFSLGQVFSVKLVLINASREGARVGSLGRPSLLISQTVQRYLASSGIASESVQIQIDGAQAKSGESVRVAVTYPVKLAVPLPGLPDPLPLQSFSVMRIE
ncbi:MAG: TadE family protein [Bacteroidota bacterium]